MLVKLLNGDLIDLGENPGQNIHYITNGIACCLNVHPDQVVVCNEDSNIPTVFIRPKPVIDLRGRDDIHWEFMPNLDLSTCINSSILQYAESIREELPVFRQNQLDLPRNIYLPKQYVTAYDNVDDPSESNINRMKASGFQQFSHIRAFSINPHDDVVDFLLTHPSLIHYPEFLGNSNQRAVLQNLEWLNRNYSRLENIFIDDPSKETEYRMFLRLSDSEEIFWTVWRECPELRPRTANDILDWVSQFPNVDVIFEEKKV